MKNIIYSLVFLFLIWGCSCKQSERNKAIKESYGIEDFEDIRFFGIRSGIITYKFKENSSVLKEEMESEGIIRYTFKDWGSMVREEIEKKEKFSGLDGGTVHELRISKDGAVYEVDELLRQITQTKDSRLILMVKMKKNNLQQATKKFMTDIGGEKIGVEKIQGYQCDVWKIEATGTKTWVHKGIVLKTETKMTGKIYTEEAITVRFNTRVPNPQFELPKDFTLIQRNDEEQTTFDEMKVGVEELRDLKSISYEEWKKKMRAEGGMEELSEKQLKQAYNAMKEMFSKK